MPRPRFTNLPRERRQEILACAGREFAEHGYDGASLNGILASAELSKGAFYYYFDDKADLFVTVFAELVGDLFERIDFDLTDLEADSYWPRLVAMTMEMMTEVEDKPWIMGVAKALYQAPRSLWEESHFADYFAEQQQFLHDLVARGRELGVVRDDMPIDLLLKSWMGLDRAFDEWFVDHPETLEDPEQAIRWYQLGIDLMKRVTMPADMLAKELTP